MLNLIYVMPQKQKAELIKSDLVAEEFGRLNNYAIEPNNNVMDQLQFGFNSVCRKMNEDVSHDWFCFVPGSSSPDQAYTGF